MKPTPKPARKCSACGKSIELKQRTVVLHGRTVHRHCARAQLKAADYRNLTNPPTSAKKE